MYITPYKLSLFFVFILLFLRLSVDFDLCWFLPCQVVVELICKLIDESSKDEHES
jgi:hypothetical protein